MDKAQPVLREPDSPASRFERLLQRLHPERDRAGQLYEDLRRRLNKFFQYNYCSPVEDLADVALDRVAQKLATEEIHNLPAFVWGVANNLVRECRRRPPTISMEDLPVSQHPHTGHAEAQMVEDNEMQRRSECLRRCLQKLSTADYELFLEYPYYTGNLWDMAELAKRMQLSVSALQARAHRVKHKVQTCVSLCLRIPRSKDRPDVKKPRSNDGAHDQ